MSGPSQSIYIIQTSEHSREGLRKGTRSCKTFRI